MASSLPIRVLAAVAERDGRFLICQRPPNKRHGGLWEFPGGKCEGGETDLDAARRELREELGVAVVTVGRALFTASDPGSSFLIAFVPVTFEGEAACLEHTALAWETLESLDQYALAPSDRMFVDWLKDHR